MGGIHTITVKERLILTRDSYLLLDDRSERRTSAQFYHVALAHDGSTSPPADADHEEEVVS